MFSSRIPASLEPNSLATTAHRLKSRGIAFLDLTESNPTRVGLRYPPDLMRALGADEALRYDPAPFGIAAAREAVANDFARRGAAISPEQIVLTASTSEAYSLLFKLLCDAGDDVLVPTPSYPLFEHLTRLDAIRSVTYRLDFHGRWSIDAATVRSGLSPRTRAILLVSPNNPTGSIATGEEMAQLLDICRERSIGLVVDEVFADYPVDAQGRTTTPIPPDSGVLSFRLGGLSKTVGLPQAKLGWIAIEGPGALVDGALSRLELICDTYLSVSTPVQAAAGALLADGAAVRAQIQARIAVNHRLLFERSARHPSCRVLPVEAGWSAVIRVPSVRTDEVLAIELLERDAVLVYPGYFFDLPPDAFLVVSLLPLPEVFGPAVDRLFRRAEADPS